MSASDGCQMGNEVRQTVSDRRQAASDGRLKVTVYLDPPTFEFLKREAQRRKSTVAAVGGEIIRYKAALDRFIEGDMSALKQLVEEGLERAPEEVKRAYYEKRQVEEVKQPLQDYGGRRRFDRLDYLAVALLGATAFFVALGLIIPLLP